jgi:hypothetical protein
MQTLHALHIAHVLSSGFMFGIVASAQCVMYPGFAFKDTARFQEAMQHHQRSITPLVAPGMLVEGVSAGLLLIMCLRESRLGDATMSGSHQGSVSLAVTNALLLMACWLLTFLHIVPMHMQLTTGTPGPTRDQLVTRLVRHHWLRFSLWALHVACACIMLAQAFDRIHA